MLLPLLVGVLAFVLVRLRNDMTLFEEGDVSSDSFIQVFLVDFNPVDITRLLADFDAFENLLLVGFERWQIL
jgi:hypothetical protein